MKDCSFDDGRRQGYRYGYEQGYEDGKKISCDYKDNMKSEYNRGLNDAWECIKKIFQMDDDTTEELFGCVLVHTITKKYCVSDVLQIIKEYEAKKKQDTEIKVGDEVFYMDENDLRVVVRISNQMDVVQITKDGKCAINDVEELHRTGRTFPQIAEVFAEMRGE